MCMASLKEECRLGILSTHLLLSCGANAENSREGPHFLVVRSIF